MIRSLPVLLAILAMSLPAAAQQPPACTAQRAGTVACMSGKLCECRYERGGTITGVPTGHRWDCGILRPSCGEALAAPTIPNQGMSPMPFQPQILIDPRQPRGGYPYR